MDASSDELATPPRTMLVRKMRGQDWRTYGRVCDVIGTVVEGYLPGVNSEAGSIRIKNTDESVLCEVVGFRDDRVLLLPYND